MDLTLRIEGVANRKACNRTCSANDYGSRVQIGSLICSTFYSPIFWVVGGKMTSIRKRGTRGTETFNRTKFEGSVRAAARRTTDCRDRAGEIARELADQIEQSFRDRDTTTDAIRGTTTNELNTRGYRSVATEYNRREFRRAQRASTGTTGRTTTGRERRAGTSTGRRQRRAGTGTGRGETRTSRR